jgi:hypothetical protein
MPNGFADIVCTNGDFDEIAALRPDCNIVRVVYRESSEHFPHGFTVLLSIPRANIDAYTAKHGAPLLPVGHGEVVHVRVRPLPAAAT